MKQELEFKVEGKEWGSLQDSAFNKLNKEAKIDGFRPGKAPRAMFEKKYGKQEILFEAADMAIKKEYERVLSEGKILPVIEPKIDLVSCDDDKLEVKFVFVTEPKVELGNYTNLKVKREKVKVTKEEVKERIDALLNEYAELVEKTGKVENGDIAVINFAGFKDGVAFDGGKAENYELEIGSHSFIPGFEEGIIGMEKGEEKDLNLTFPKDYASEELKGQKVVFKVKVNDIKERVIPELDKEFFEDLDMPGVQTKEDLEKEVESHIKAHKEEHIENEYVDALLEKASSNMEVEIDAEIVEDETEKMYNELLQRMQMQGITEEIYLQYANTTKEKITEQMKEEAEKRIKYRYLLRAIIKAEKIKVTDKQAEKEVENMAATYGMTKEDVMKEIGNIEVIKYDMMMRKAIEVMKEDK